MRRPTALVGDDGTELPVPWRPQRVRPIGHLVSVTAWRRVVFLLSGSLLGLLLLGVLVLASLVGVALAPLGIGMGLLLAIPTVAIGAARVERVRIRLVDPVVIADPHRAFEGKGIRALLRVRLRERATWRELAYAVLSGALVAPVALVLIAGLGVGTALVGSPLIVLLVAPDTVMLVPGQVVDGAAAALPFSALGLLLAALCLHLASALAVGQVTLARMLLASREEELDARVMELSASRVRLAAAFDAERRRIERDLHDGAQQQLAAVVMTLGLAEHRLGDSPDLTRELLGRAREQATGAQERLRALIRGIHPRVLEDHGLAAAVREATAGHRPPVAITLDLPRLPGPVESAAYFVVLEGLANAARHSRAQQVSVSGGLQGAMLVVTVTDDGRGGADPAHGSGLQGLADRVAVLGGRLSVSSPIDGPTVLRTEIPWRA